MELLLKKSFEIILNEGGGAVSILLIVNIWLMIKVSNRFKAIEKTIDGLDDLIKKEISDIELIMVKKYVEWDTFNKLRDKVSDLGNEVAKIAGRLNGRK